MKKAWGALRDAVGEINQVLFEDSEGEDADTTSEVIRDSRSILGAEELASWVSRHTLFRQHSLRETSLKTCDQAKDCIATGKIMRKSNSWPVCGASSFLQTTQHSGESLRQPGSLVAVPHLPRRRKTTDSAVELENGHTSTEAFDLDRQKPGKCSLHFEKMFPMFHSFENHGDRGLRLRNSVSNGTPPTGPGTASLESPHSRVVCHFENPLPQSGGGEINILLDKYNPDISAALRQALIENALEATKQYKILFDSYQRLQCRNQHLISTNPMVESDNEGWSKLIPSASSPACANISSSEVEAMRVKLTEVQKQAHSWEHQADRLSDQLHEQTCENVALLQKLHFLEQRVATFLDCDRELSNATSEALLVPSLEKEVTDLRERLEEERREKQAAKEISEKLTKLLDDQHLQHAKALQDSNARTETLVRDLAAVRESLSSCSIELETLREEAAKTAYLERQLGDLKRDVESKNRTVGELGQSLETLVNRLAEKSEDSEFLIDKRFIFDAVLRYTRLLADQGVVTPIGRTRDELVFVLTEATGFDKNDALQIFGLSDDVVMRVRLNRSKAAESEQKTLNAASEGARPPTNPRRNLLSLFLDYIEGEAL